MSARTIIVVQVSKKCFASLQTNCLRARKVPANLSHLQRHTRAPGPLLLRAQALFSAVQQSNENLKKILTIFFKTNFLLLP
jgi:hypothetical protein